MTNAKYFLLTFCFFPFSYIYSQGNGFNPFQLKVEYFSDAKKIENGMIFDEKGITYKIVNTEYKKGLKIVDKDKGEVWQGLVFSFSSGKLYDMTTYELGKRNGLYEQYSAKSGKVLFRKQFVNDLIEGKSYQYADEGNYLYCETEYLHGERNGEVIYYSTPENGNYITTKNIYKDGKMVESTTYTKDGKIYSNKKY